MARGGFDGVGRDAGHAAMVGWAAAQKTGAAVWFFLDDGATRSDGGGAEGIGRSEYGDDGETNGCGDVHRAGVIANEEMALRKKRGQIGDGRFSSEIDRRAAHACRNGGRDGSFCEMCRRE